ncbi:DUF4282 domain-containing protein [Klebsiella quasipneumoniae]
MKSVFGFDAMLTPKILVVIYWISMLCILGVGVYSIISDHPVYAAIGTIGGLIGCRMCFELIMIAFKNNEYLRRIAENNKS